MVFNILLNINSTLILFYSYKITRSVYVFFRVIYRKDNITYHV